MAQRKPKAPAPCHNTALPKPERVRLWCAVNFAPQYVERVTEELLDAFSEGFSVPFHASAFAAIFPEAV